MSKTIQLLDSDSNQYIFEVYPLGVELNKFSGIYTFCYYSKTSQKWHLTYIGQTENFSARVDQRLLQHHKLECSLEKGATHIGLYPLKGGEIMRRKVEDKLISYYEPSCNGSNNH